MKLVNKDKNLSGALILFTILCIMYILGADGGFSLKNSITMKELGTYIFEFYFDFIVIGYVFFCLQIAGYLELKHKQDFLTISIVSILFTPLSIFFVYKEKK